MIVAAIEPANNSSVPALAAVTCEQPRLGLAEAYVLTGRLADARRQLDLLSEAALRPVDPAPRDDLSPRIDLA